MMTGKPPGPALSLVDMLRDEFEMIHGPFDAEYVRWDAEAREQGDGAPSFDRRLQAFHAQVHALDPPRSALCLSGGGIRSASFCLGVLQTLARNGTLERFHYLSTVSGGGYVGAWLTAWIHRHFEAVRKREAAARRQEAAERRREAVARRQEAAERRREAVASEGAAEASEAEAPEREAEAPEREAEAPEREAEAPEREARPQILSGVSRLLALTPGTTAGTAATGLGGERPPEPQEVAHVRRYTNFLSPRTGLLSLDAWTLAAVYLRNLALNWLVLVPLLVVVVSVPYLARALLAGIWPAGPTALTGVSVLGPPALALTAWAVLIALTVIYGRFKDVATVERRQRVEAGLLAFASSWAGLSALILYGPALFDEALARLSALGAGGGAATFVLKKLGDRLTAASERGGRAKAVRRATIVGAAVTIAALLAGISLGVGALMERVGAGLPGWIPGVGAELVPALAAAVVMLGAAAVSALFAYLVDINEFSLHALYRNRLVRAFLRASRSGEARTSDDAFHGDDDLDLVRLWPSRGPESRTSEGQRPHLFHVINATLNDVASTRTEWSERKGVSFTFSPLHYGAHIVGRYRGRREEHDGRPTDEDVGSRTDVDDGGRTDVDVGGRADEDVGGRADEGAGRPTDEEKPGGYRRLRSGEHQRAGDPLTLGTAMAISGAAANPNMGYHSSALVSALMAFFNVRLGWWMQAPWMRGASTRLPATPGSTWRAWGSEVLGLTRFDAPIVNVSDGGHFDNLGLYEMVRRRCRYIVVVDAGRDARGEFAALGEVLRRIRVDFGISITFSGLDVTEAGPARAAVGADQAPVHAWHGTIHYSEVDRDLAPEVGGGEGGSGSPAPEAPDGELVYLRPVVTGDEPVDVQTYHRLHPDFPHESTADQWFSESQFESYRRLGEHSLERLLDYYRANKDWPRPDVVQEVRSALPPRADAGAPDEDADADDGTIGPAELCHQVGEALSLLRRQRRASTRSGGVVYRPRSDGDVSFLLVRSMDHTCRVLPKGHIEPGEDAVTTAVREVREETGFELEPEHALGAFPIPGQREAVTYFLMPAPTERASAWPHERHREPAWFTCDEAGRSEPPVPTDVLEVLERARGVIRRGAGRGGGADEVQEEVQARIEAEVQEEVQARIEAEVQEEVQARIEAEVQKEVQARIEAEVQDQAEREASWGLPAADPSAAAPGRHPPPSPATLAGGIVYRRDDDGRLEVLLVRSSDGRFRVLPKGHVEAGETEPDAAAREVREETGYDLEASERLATRTLARDGGQETVAYFLMPAEGVERARAPEPGRDPCWFALDELEEPGALDLPLPDDVQPLLREVGARGR